MQGSLSFDQLTSIVCNKFIHPRPQRSFQRPGRCPGVIGHRRNGPEHRQRLDGWRLAAVGGTTTPGSATGSTTTPRTTGLGAGSPNYNAGGIAAGANSHLNPSGNSLINPSPSGSTLTLGGSRARAPAAEPRATKTRQSRGGLMPMARGLLAVGLCGAAQMPSSQTATMVPSTASPLIVQPVT